MSGIEPKRRPLVSVILPTYDLVHRGRRLQSALASVHSQEGLGEIFDLEVIVAADDVSSGPTPEVIRRYPGTQYLSLEPRGMWAAINAGLEAATGKYVGFLGDDDLWLPDKLSVQVPVLEASPELSLLYSRQIIVFGNDVTVWPSVDAPSGHIFNTLLMGNLAGMQSVLVPREIFEIVGYFDQELSAHAEYEMWLRISFHFPLIFEPGPDSMWLRTVRGFFSADAAQGISERELPMVLERALAMIRDVGGDDGQLREEALARGELGIAWALESVGQFERIPPHLLKALEMFPSVAMEPESAGRITRQAVLSFLASDSPIAAADSFCREMKTAVDGMGFQQRLGMRRMVARLWMGVANGLAKRSGPQDRSAASAAARGILQNPLQLRGKKMRSLIMRALFSRPSKEGEGPDTPAN